MRLSDFGSLFFPFSSEGFFLSLQVIWLIGFYHTITASSKKLISSLKFPFVNTSVADNDKTYWRCHTASSVSTIISLEDTPVMSYTQYTVYQYEVPSGIDNTREEEAFSKSYTALTAASRRYTFSKTTTLSVLRPGDAGATSDTLWVHSSQTEFTSSYHFTWDPTDTSLISNETHYRGTSTRSTRYQGDTKTTYKYVTSVYYNSHAVTQRTCTLTYHYNSEIVTCSCSDSHFKVTFNQYFHVEGSNYSRTAFS